MSTKINVRSPYYKKVSDALLTSATMSLHIYEGTLGSRPSDSLKYTITKTPVGSNTYVVFEIAELVRDYLDNSFNGTYSSNCVWVEADVVKTLSSGGPTNDNSDYLAVGGYGYFEDGINPTISDSVLISNDTIFYNEGEDIIIPISAEDVYRVSFGSEAGENWESVDDNWEAYNEDWGGLQPDIIITDNGNSNQKIQYVTISSSELFTDQDKILFYNSGGALLRTIYLDEVCEPKYTPYKVVFYNKFGALQDVWFFKRSDTSINIQSDSYKSNILDLSSLSYATTSHQVQTFNVNGNETITLNSGFYDEQYNEVVRQMLLSEEVWIDDGTDVLPVNINTKSYRFQKNVNDKLIQHTLEFSYAYDKINNVR